MEWNFGSRSSESWCRMWETSAVSSLYTEVFILQHTGQAYAIRVWCSETILLSVLFQKLQASICFARPYEENWTFLIITCFVVLFVSVCVCVRARVRACVRALSVCSVCFKDKQYWIIRIERTFSISNIIETVEIKAVFSC